MDENKRPHMTPQERIRAAQEMFRRARSQPGLPMRLRKELRRVAYNLVTLNMIPWKRHLMPPRPASLAKRKKPD